MSVTHTSILSATSPTVRKTIQNSIECILCGVGLSLCRRSKPYRGPSLWELVSVMLINLRALRMDKEAFEYRKLIN